MTTEQAAVNGISITFEDKGPRDAPVILLVMGLGGQLTLWPDEFVDALNARGLTIWASRGRISSACRWAG